MIRHIHIKPNFDRHYNRRLPSRLRREDTQPKGMGLLTDPTNIIRKPISGKTNKNKRPSDLRFVR